MRFSAGQIAYLITFLVLSLVFIVYAFTLDYSITNPFGASQLDDKITVALGLVVFAAGVALLPGWLVSKVSKRRKKPSS